MSILEELYAEHMANQAQRAAIETEKVYLAKMIELIEKVLACKEAGLSFEALEKAEMYLSEEAYRMEQADAGIVGNEKIWAGDTLLEDVSLYPQLRKEV